MTRNLKKRRRRSRKRWFPFLATGIAGLHLLLFLLLAQCGGVAPGYKSEVTYIRLQSEEKSEVRIAFEEPPERMFSHYVKSSDVALEEEPVPLQGPRWDGYQTLAALRAEEAAPYTNYRLTMQLQREERAPRAVHYHYHDIFSPVIIRGVPMQPVTPVPEPGVGVAVLFSLVLSLTRRVRT